MSAFCTKITAKIPQTLTKIYSMTEGGLKKETSGNLINGEFEKITLNTITDLRDTISSLSHNQALTYGITVETNGTIITQKEWVSAEKNTGVIARSRKHFRWHSGPGVMMLDYDPPDDQQPLKRKELIGALKDTAPWLEDVDMLWMPSASSHITTNEMQDVTGLKGQRVYFLVSDATQIPTIGLYLSSLLWANDGGYIFVSKGGLMYERTLFDGAVWQPERLDFAAGALCGEGIHQNRGDGVLLMAQQRLLDVANVIPPPPAVMQLAQKNKDNAKESLREYANTVRDQWIRERSEEMVKKSNGSLSDKQAAQTATRAVKDASLEEDFILTVFVDNSRKNVSVKDVLKDPNLFDGAITLDPIEPEYDNSKPTGKLFLSNGNPSLYSFAHGGCTFSLESQPTITFVPEEAKEQKNPCDAFTTNALPPLIADYINAMTETTEAHIVMMTQSLMGALSGIFIRKMFIPNGEYFQRLSPNIWTLAIAGSGEFKSTALNVGSALAYAEDARVKEEAKKTKPSNYKDLSDKDKKKIDQEMAEILLKTPIFPSKITTEATLERLALGGTGVVICNEFGAWAKNMKLDHNSGMKEVFTDLYDGLSYNYHTKGHGHYDIDNGAFSICSVSTLEWIKENLSKTDLASGFFSRFLIFYPPTSGFHVPAALPTPIVGKGLLPYQKAVEDVVTSIRTLTHYHPIEYVLDPIARKAFFECHNEIYEKIKNVEGADRAILTAWAKRWSPIVLKVAMILQPFFDHNTKTISPHAILAAHSIVIVAVDCTLMLYNKELTSSSEDNQKHKLLAWIKRRYEKNSRPVKRREIFTSKVLSGSREYNTILDNLIQSGLLVAGNDHALNPSSSTEYSPILE